MLENVSNDVKASVVRAPHQFRSAKFTRRFLHASRASAARRANIRLVSTGRFEHRTGPRSRRTTGRTPESCACGDGCRNGSPARRDFVSALPARSTQRTLPHAVYPLFLSPRRRLPAKQPSGPRIGCNPSPVVSGRNSERLRWTPNEQCRNPCSCRAASSTAAPFASNVADVMRRSLISAKIASFTSPRLPRSSAFMMIFIPVTPPSPSLHQCTIEHVGWVGLDWRRLFNCQVQEASPFTGLRSKYHTISTSRRDMARPARQAVSPRFCSVIRAPSTSMPPERPNTEMRRRGPLPPAVVGPSTPRQLLNRRRHFRRILRRYANSTARLAHDCGGLTFR